MIEPSFILADEQVFLKPTFALKKASKAFVI
jgi:hypothetical protein